MYSTSALEVDIMVLALTQMFQVFSASRSHIDRTADIEEMRVEKEDFVHARRCGKRIHVLNYLSFSRLVFAGCQRNKAIPFSHRVITPMLGSHRLIIPFFLLPTKAVVGNVILTIDRKVDK